MQYIVQFHSTVEPYVFIVRINYYLGANFFRLQFLTACH